jgi:chromosome segregation ATPase
MSTTDPDERTAHEADLAQKARQVAETERRLAAIEIDLDRQAGQLHNLIAEVTRARSAAVRALDVCAVQHCDGQLGSTQSTANVLKELRGELQSQLAQLQQDKALLGAAAGG